ncbi:hypothetical protein KA005_55115, partial [bacterium]|nr:hypothetical protein [bacterium]
MTCFWRTREGFSRLKLAVSRLLRLVSEDIRYGTICAAGNLFQMLGVYPSMKSLAERFGIIPSNYSSLMVSSINQNRKLSTGQSA